MAAVSHIRAVGQVPDKRPERDTTSWIHPAFWLTLMVGLYLLTSLAIPITQETPLVDEPIYASSAFEFARSGRLVISELAAPNALVGTILGGWSADLLGSTLGSLRLATLLFTALSAPFMYLLCRSLGASRALAYLGTAAYLLAPLALALTRAFHTDPFSVALVVIGMSVLAAGFQRDRDQAILIGIGSGVISLSLLSRPQNVVVAGAAGLAWMLWGNHPRRWHGTALIVIPPVLTLWAHSAWTTKVGEPFIRTLYRQDLLQSDLASVLKVGSQTAITAAIYVGLFALPLLPILIPRDWRGLLSQRFRLSLYLGVGLLAAAVGMISFGIGPFDLQAWISNGGFGAVDRSFLGNRPELPPQLLHLITVTLFASAYIWLLKAVPSDPWARGTASHKFVLISGLGLSGSVLVSSLPFHAHVLDRYWFPLVPVTIAIAAATGIGKRARLLTAWCLVALLASVAVLGLRDAFVVYREAETFAFEVIASGTDPLEIDAGASWSGSYFGLQNDEPAKSLARLGPFWLRFYAVDLNPKYAIALSPIPGYEVLGRHEYHSMLHPGEDYLYLVYRSHGPVFYLRPADF